MFLAVYEVDKHTLCRHSVHIASARGSWIARLDKSRRADTIEVVFWERDYYPVAERLLHISTSVNYIRYDTPRPYVQIMDMWRSKARDCDQNHPYASVCSMRSSHIEMEM